MIGLYVKKISFLFTWRSLSLSFMMILWVAFVTLFKGGSCRCPEKFIIFYWNCYCCCFQRGRGCLIGNESFLFIIYGIFCALVKYMVLSIYFCLMHIQIQKRNFWCKVQILKIVLNIDSLNACYFIFSSKELFLYFFSFIINLLARIVDLCN